MKKILLFIALIGFGITFGMNNFNYDENQITDKAINYGDYCMNETFGLMDIALDLGFSVDETTCIANAFYAECEGFANASYEGCVD
tara:strand:+ start:152 stop:409 length:258 start_codon:yes stop_codon:yes gene_type:complete